MTTTIAALVRALKLRPHPEGGFYRETFRSRVVVPRAGLPGRFPGARPAATSILYLLPAGARSAWHRIRSDELWSFHLGGPLRLCEISPPGTPRCTLIGPQVDRRQVLQHVVPAGSWFAAKPAPGTPYTLVGCMVAPGFEFEDFEMARAGALERRYPKLRKLVRLYT